MRQQYLKLQEKLAAHGLSAALQLFSMTPREISLAISLQHARERKEMQRLWLLSRYTALAVHAPERLPPPPTEDMPEMTDEEMKRRLLAWRRKDDL